MLLFHRYCNLFVFIFVLGAVVSGWPVSSAQSTSELQVIEDAHFRQGLVLWDPKPGQHLEYGRMPGVDGTARPVWGLAQWSSKYPLDPAAVSRESGSYILSNAAKSIRLAFAGADLSLAVNSAVEYGPKARVARDPWVHLLVEQEFRSPPFLQKISAARFHLEARLVRARNLHRDDYSPSVHAAQFQVFFTVQNRNSQSAGRGDLLWFGIPVFDNRHSSPPEYKSKDFGGTEKFIFTPAATKFTAESTRDGEWVVIDRDLLPLMKEALEAAWAKGFLSASKDIADYAIGGMNMGWEVPGTFDVELEVRNLGLLASFVKAHAGPNLTVLSPRDFQVVQRRDRETGSVNLDVVVAGAGTQDHGCEARLIVDGKPSAWRQIPASTKAGRFQAQWNVPAGGWYRLEVRAVAGTQVVAEGAVEHVGVGEVFVVAGQSNSANHGAEKQETKTQVVAAFDGENWRLARDPQPGASGEGGSFMPSFGDAIAARFHVPVGIVACGVGATSVREWLPKGAVFPNPPTLTNQVQPRPDGTWESKGTLFARFTEHMKTLGPGGFRAVLWHQGESDANQDDPTRTLSGPFYREYLERLIRDSRREIGWDAPWFVAQASYHRPGDESSAAIRDAQASLWKDGIALEGPDTDALRGDLRDNGGQGVHFSGAGLREHGARWAEKVGRWLVEREVVYATDFESSDALSEWSGTAALEPGFASQHAAALECKIAARGAVVTRHFLVEALRGCRVRSSAMVRPEQVGAKPNPWNGIKFMLIVEGPSGKSYPQAPLETGSFEWRRASFTTRIPEDATNLTLVLGLEQVSGKVWFDDLQLTVVKTPLQVQPSPVSGPAFKGHSLPRLRGAMVSPNIDAESLRVLGQDWKANLIRFQLIRTGRDVSSAAASDSYDAWLEGELKRLDAVLPLCERYGILVVVDLHSPPGGKPTAGGYFGSDNGLFSDRGAQEKFVEIWRHMATRYKGAKAIWGYDLANEPVEDGLADGCDDWQALAERAARAIRAIDPERTLIVEPAQWGSPEGLNELVPLSISNVVYSVHMYVPHAFTHQGVFASGPSYRYPGLIEGKQWDKAQLERALAPAVAFQQRYNVHLYIGEFSAIRWAPDHSAFRYLSDLIDIFEAHGWDWSYHAFREWSGWSVEHSSDRQETEPAASSTERQRLLRDWFSRNEKP